MSLLAVPDLHFRRYRQIAEALTRHGLRWLRDASGLGRFRPLRFDLDEGDQVESLTAAVRVRLALEEIGATFIKLGQFLSTRADLLPLEYQTELAKLQDSAPPFDSKTAKEMIEAELGQPTSALFASFDLEPLAAASIGQAHTATLRDGAEVIVKVRRQDVVEQIKEYYSARSAAHSADDGMEPRKRLGSDVRAIRLSGGTSVAVSLLSETRLKVKEKEERKK
jgi:ubiquinone biosynthesis protein